jgi:MFS family permease
MKDQGNALGTWNSIGPIAYSAGPLTAGLIIDRLGWKNIFVPVLIIAALSLLAVAKGIRREEAHSHTLQFLKAFDWLGALFLFGGTTLFVLFLSSRTITGAAPLTDLRLLGPCLLFFCLFFVQERRHTRPLVSFSLFRQGDFAFASIGAAVRMFVMSAISFLVPLYLSDIKSISFTVIGIIFAGHSASIMITLRLGGRLGDIWTSRWPVVISNGIQVFSMILLALLPQSSPLGWFITGLTIHGVGAGLSLAALHRSALHGVSSQSTGIAAGLYGMTRYGGSMLGTAVAGILLRWGLARELLTIAAYQQVFWLLAGICVVGILFGLRLRK